MPAREYRQVRFDLRRGPAPGNPWLAWALHLAHVTGEARGWQPDTRRKLQRVLVTLLAGHRGGEAISASAVHAVAGRYSVGADCALEIVAAMGILAEDRPGLFTGWLDAKLAGLAEGLGSEARRWAITLHNGGPRTLPRSPDTARCYVRAAAPALLAWSARYDHLREVTRDDVVGYIVGLHGHERYTAVSALRSLFTWAKTTGVIFRNPATRIKLGKREHPVWQPLDAGHIADAAAAAATPQARLCVVLAAVQAARLGAIRALQLDDADLDTQRLRIVGADRPMGELTCKVLCEWLEYRQHRWPHTANPHLLVSKESALRHGPVSTAYLTSLRGLPATLERLRIDCQLTEAIATGFDPLHLAHGLRHQRADRDPVRHQRPPAVRTGSSGSRRVSGSPPCPARNCGCRGMDLFH